MRRDEYPPCPRSTDRRHNWLEVTMLGEADGAVGRYVCNCCGTEAVEPMPLGQRNALAD